MTGPHKLHFMFQALYDLLLMVKCEALNDYISDRINISHRMVSVMCLLLIGVVAVLIHGKLIVIVKRFLPFSRRKRRTTSSRSYVRVDGVDKLKITSDALVGTLELVSLMVIFVHVECPWSLSRY